MAEAGNRKEPKLEPSFGQVQLLKLNESSANGLGCSRQHDSMLRLTISDKNIILTAADGKEVSRLPMEAITTFDLAGRSVAVRPKQASNTSSLILYFATAQDAGEFRRILNQSGNQHTNSSKSAFDQRTEEASAAQYFQFYGYLSQQQNMMQDFVRTATYQKAMHANLADFKDKIVLDVGAGSGILSFFAIQAGAKRVYAVEASSMAEQCEALVKANGMQDRIHVVAGKIEEIELPELVDVIISEPMGYMLINERMLETYLHAKKFLKPKGRMYPTRGDLHIAPFSDESLFIEQTSKANFWCQESFHGVDLTHLRSEAVNEYFKQPVVDTWHIGILLAQSHVWKLNFDTADETDLHNIVIPFVFELQASGFIHGLAFWFDVAFIGGSETVWLSTSPTEPLTHWYQVRCLLRNPIFGIVGQLCTGKVVLRANDRQSYDVDIEVEVDGKKSMSSLDLKNPYFRYTGQPVQPPATNSSVSPTELYWNAVSQQQQLHPGAVVEQSVPIQNGTTNGTILGQNISAVQPNNNIMDLLANAHAAYQRNPMVGTAGGGGLPTQQVQGQNLITSHPLKMYHNQQQHQQSQSLPFSSPGYPATYMVSGQQGRGDPSPRSTAPQWN